MQVKQIEIHGRSLKKPANRELIVERARGFRRSLASLRAEYESARAQHEQEVSVNIAKQQCHDLTVLLQPRLRGSVNIAKQQCHDLTEPRLQPRATLHALEINHTSQCTPCSLISFFPFYPGMHERISVRACAHVS